jgi:hypothetical protein
MTLGGGGGGGGGVRCEGVQEAHARGGSDQLGQTAATADINVG